MKTTTILVCGFLLLAISAPAAAQHEIGVIAGLNLAHLHSIELEERGHVFSHLVRFGAGAVIDLSLTNRFGLRIEPIYVLKGAKGNITQGTEIETKITLEYLQLPVLLKYAFKGRSVRPYVMLGPSIGFRLKAKRTLSGPGTEPAENGKDIKEETNGINFGMNLDIGMNLPIGHNNLFLEIFWAEGLTNIYDNQRVTDDVSKTTTHDIQIMTGITFPLGKKD